MPKRLPADLQLLAKGCDRRAPPDRRNGFRLHTTAPRLKSDEPLEDQLSHLRPTLGGSDDR
jgi:hypothetical protein